MKLTLLTWITFFFLALLMGLNNIYSTLLTGWGGGGSIVAVILCLLFLTKNQRNIINYNLGQTMASAGGSVGFSVAIVGSIYYSYNQQGMNWDPPLIELSLLIMALSIIGVALAVPIRPYTIRWFFPSAVACATILRAVTSENIKEQKRARTIMGTSGLISALLTLPTKAAIKPGGHALWSKIVLIPNVSISLDPLLYGIGIVIGPRIGISMLLGALINVLILSPQLMTAGAQVDEYIRWVAVGLMTLPAFTSVIFSFIFKSTLTLPPGFKPKEFHEEEKLSLNQWLMIGMVFLGAVSITILTMKSIFGISWYYVLLAICLAGPMCFTLGKVASETDINPVRLIAIFLLFIFSIFERHSPVALLAIGISGATFAAIAVDLFYDLRTGYLIRANPIHQIFVQFLGVLPVSFASIFFLHVLATKFGFGEGKYFPAPSAIVWSVMADAFSLGTSAVTPGIWIATGIASLIGIILTFFRGWGPTHSYTPSSFAMGIALLLPFEMSAAIFLGSLIRLLITTLARPDNRRQIEEDAYQAGSAIFAASAFAGIIAVILISLGILHLPK